jgi:heptosyltransferase II
MEILKREGEKILVIQTAFLGDAVLTLPMIQKLKEMYRNSIIDVLCIQASKEIFQLSPFINDVIVIDKKGEHKSLFGLLKFIRQIRSAGYNKIYSPHRSFRTSILVLQSGVKETFGYSNSSMFHIYKYITEYIPNHHEVQRNLDLIGYDYQKTGWRILPQVNIPESSEKKVRDFLESSNIKTNFAALAPGSIWNTKKYPLEYYEQVIKYLIELGLKVIIIGSRQEEDIGKSLELKFHGSLISAAGIMTITESIALLKHSKILISNDSAPSHLGVCADVPVLTLYCSTVPDFGFYPYNNKSRWLSYSELECKPCGIHGYGKCPLKHFNCGYKLDAGLVNSTLQEILND